MSIFKLENLDRIAKCAIEIVCITGFVSLLKLLGWSSLTLVGFDGPLSIAICSLAFFNVRLLLQQKILTGSFFAKTCPIGTKSRLIALSTVIATQIAAIIFAAFLLPAAVVIGSPFACALVAVVAFVGSVFSNIPNRLLAKFAER